MQRLHPKVRMIAVESEAAVAGLAGKGDIVCLVSGGNIDAPKLGAILNGQNPF
jgi:hypothetical protein